MTLKFRLLLPRANWVTTARGLSGSSTKKLQVPPLEGAAEGSPGAIVKKEKLSPKMDTQIPKSLELLPRNKRKFYITDQTVSRYIPQILGNTITSNTCAVALMYPGPGPLAREVLEQGAKNVFLFEPNGQFREMCNTLQIDETQQLHIVDGKYFRGVQGRFSPDQRILDLFKNPQFLQFKVVTVVSTNSHAKQIVLDFLDGNFDENWKNIEYFLLANNVTAHVMDQKRPGSRRLRNYWPWYLWAFFTNTTKIATFTPSDEQTSSQVLTLYKTTYQSWPLNLGVPNFKVTKNERRMLCTFTRYCCADAGGLVVASLEKVSPRIGLQLLRYIDSLNLHTKFYQLTPEEFLMVYSIFRKNNLNKTQVWQVLDEEWDSQLQED